MKTRKPRQKNLSGRKTEKTLEEMKEEVLSSRREPRSRAWEASTWSRWSRKLETSDKRCVSGGLGGAEEKETDADSDR